MDDAWWYGWWQEAARRAAAVAKNKTQRRSLKRSYGHCRQNSLICVAESGESARSTTFPPFRPTSTPARQTDRQTDERYLLPAKTTLPTPLPQTSTTSSSATATNMNTIDIGGGQIH